MLNKQKMIENCILWNKKEFYRAINDERWVDAERFKGNVEKLEDQLVER